jgi:nitrogen fixation NifU-like protein
MNRGAMELPHLVGKGSLDGYPPFLTLYLRLEGNRVVDAAFEAEGCGVTIACGSALTELVQSCDLARVRPNYCSRTFGGAGWLAGREEYCAEGAIRALKDAVERRAESLSRSGVER